MGVSSFQTKISLQQSESFHSFRVTEWGKSHLLVLRIREFIFTTKIVEMGRVKRERGEGDIERERERERESEREREKEREREREERDEREERREKRDEIG